MPLSAPHLTRGGVCTNAGAGSATQTFTSVLPIDLALGIHFGPTECRAIVVSPSPERDGAQVIALASEDFRFVDDEGNELNSGLVWQQALERLGEAAARACTRPLCVQGGRFLSP